MIAALATAALGIGAAALLWPRTPPQTEAHSVPMDGGESLLWLDCVLGFGDDPPKERAWGSLSAYRTALGGPEYMYLAKVAEPFRATDFASLLMPSDPPDARVEAATAMMWTEFRCRATGLERQDDDG